MSESKRIYLNENLVVFFSEHPTWTVGYRMNEAKIKLAVRKGYTVTIMNRGGE
jgi:hypothetical protein